MIVFGVIGWLFRKLDIPTVPIILGILLGKHMEDALPPRHDPVGRRLDFPLLLGHLNRPLGRRCRGLRCTLLPPPSDPQTPGDLGLMPIILSKILRGVWGAAPPRGSATKATKR